MEINEQLIREFTQKYPWIIKIQAKLIKAVVSINRTFQNGGKLIIAGNGGSFSDALHISGELLKSFERKHIHSREFLAKIETSWAKEYFEKIEPSFPVIVLGTNPVLQTAFLNDVKTPELIFAQELYNLAKPGDIFFGISTSGSSMNILLAVELAKLLGIQTIGLTDQDGKNLAKTADIAIQAPIKGCSGIVQEYHVCIYHLICRLIEETWYKNER